MLKWSHKAMIKVMKVDKTIIIEQDGISSDKK